MKIAYLTNTFPSSLEPYVMAEISALRERGVEVLPCSARRPRHVSPDLMRWRMQTLHLQAPRFWAIANTVSRCCSEYRRLRPFLLRIYRGHEPFLQRAKAVVHTVMAVYYAVLLEREKIAHLHVHHGYFSSWIAMVTAQLLGISYSLTLHGSDLLVKAAYLDIKLERCRLCFTVSEYNRNVILCRYPQIHPDKVVVRRLGVDLPAVRAHPKGVEDDHRFILLVPARLHAIKNHAFLVRACAILKSRGHEFVCFLAGDGPERKNIERHIRLLGLEREVKLLGHVAHEDLQAIYPLADLVILTSTSEGIPVVLMEAMAHECLVLAPRITGIPELVADGKTGFLYRAGCLDDFVAKVEALHASRTALSPVRRAAREQVRSHFQHRANLDAFLDALCASLNYRVRHENTVLQ